MPDTVDKHQFELKTSALCKFEIESVKNKTIVGNQFCEELCGGLKCVHKFFNIPFKNWRSNLLLLSVSWA